MTKRTQTFLSSASQSITEFLGTIGFLRPPFMQVAAICYRQGANGVEVLLIESLSKGQWIVPKGWPKKRQSSAQTALDEAYEEAGIRGTINEQPIGTYRYRKIKKKGLPLDCIAYVYEVVVTETLEDFPEAGQRKHLWLAPKDAAKQVSNPELSNLLESFAPSEPPQ